MIVLRRPKHGRGRTRDVPMRVDSEQMEQANERVPHQSHATSLRGRAEEGDLSLLLAEDFGVMEHGVPSGIADGGTVVFDAVDDANSARRVRFYLVPIKKEKRDQ